MNDIVKRAYELRAIIESMADDLSDEEALGALELYPVWNGSDSYSAGTRVRYNGALYKCLQEHSAQPGWTPTAAPSLWAAVLIPDQDVTPAWVQPDSTNAYAQGDRVTHSGKTWESTVDGNVWEPGVYGWTEVEG